MSAIQVVVVGNGMVGHHYVETLAKSNIEANITEIILKLLQMVARCLPTINSF